MLFKIDNVVLAGAGNEGTQNLRFNGRIVTQEAEFLRADQIQVFNRGNARTVIGFTRTIRKDDLADAEVFLLEHASEVLIDGLLTITAKSETKEIERYIEAVVCRAYDAHQLGVTIFCQYEIIGGKILLEKP